MLNLLTDIAPGKYLIKDERQMHKFISSVIEVLKKKVAIIANKYCNKYYKSDPSAASLTILNEGLLKFFTQCPHYDPTTKCISGIEDDKHLVNLLSKIWVRCAMDLNKKYNSQKSTITASAYDIDDLQTKSHHKTAVHSTTMVERELLTEVLSFLRSQPNQILFEVFNAYLIDGLSHAEISKKFGISVKTSRNRKSDAVELVKAHFRDRFKDLYLK